ncbi:hypothetical protein FB451DRAFT_1058020 [Mycena latifolia]|nr:hypothetical protein FB451DRAFT_1058020 [Mycena latifolia]
MVNTFLTDVLGWNNEQRGLFGHTDAFYGTVEQQGRLTLHLHLLLWIRNALSPQEIRNRIMDPTSSFRVKLIAYLESCHQAEFISGGLEDVRTNITVDLKAERKMEGFPSYIPPTHRLPLAPPKICNRSQCPGLCRQCRKFTEWWAGFSQETDDLILRSNLHDHFHSVEDEISLAQKKNWRDKKPSKTRRNKVQERKGCLTKYNVCRARFPRTVVPESVVDQDGHISVRHVEPMLNTFNPILTYFSRCNTDVMSLLSGTAVKAVISYVSDYVSKVALKSYQLFASVFQVFDSSSEMLRGDANNHERSRHLVRKMVNSLSTKMEIGSPMASMYVLGHPDHYASHMYVPFRWRSYTLFVNKFWLADDMIDDDDTQPEEKVVITRQNGQFVASSSVDDYVYRPAVFENVTLYEWVQCSDKRVRSAKERHVFAQEIQMQSHLIVRQTCKNSVHGESDDGDSDFEFSDDEDLSYNDSEVFSDSDWETDDDDEVIASKQAKLDKLRKPIRYPFLPGHPKYLSHDVLCDFSKVNSVIPNFIGGALPRADKGDRNFYCMTMLTLFKPWCSPADLKDSDSTWAQTFRYHDFTKRELELMGNFNVRYECNDARDDHFAQMQRKMKEAEAGSVHVKVHPLMGHRDQLNDDMNTVMYEYEEESDGEDGAYIGPKTMRMKQQMDEMKSILKNSGWLRKNCVGEAPFVDVDRILPEYKTRSTWSSLVKSERMKYTANKLADLPPQGDDGSLKRTNWENVEVLESNYLFNTVDFSSAAHIDLKTAIISKFTLNTEQVRAFSILADHASSRQPVPLHMYMGGMGGTGKSQVIQAMIYFLFSVMRHIVLLY